MTASTHVDPSALIDASPDIVAIVDGEGTWRVIGGAVERILGFSAADLDGAPLADSVHPDDEGVVDQALATVRARPGVSAGVEHRLRRADGGWRWVETTLVNRLDDPRIAAVVLTARDLTRRKLVEEDTRQRESHHRALLAAMPDTLFRVTRGGVYLEAQATRRSDLLHSPEQTVGRRVADLMPPEVAERLMLAIGRALDGGGVETVDYTLRTGASARDFEARIVAYTPDEAMVIVRDVSDRVAARRVREDTEAKYVALMEHSSDMVVVHDLDGNRKFVSPAAARMMGRPASELVGTNAHEHLPPEAVAALRAATAACLRHPDQHPMYTVHLPYPDLGWRTLEVVATNLLDVPGVDGIVFTSRDVTEREESAAALRASQQLLEGAFNHSGVGMAISSSGGVLHRVNQAFADLLGYEPDELVGRPIADLVHPDEAHQTRDNVRRTASAEIDGVRVERTYLRRDGSSLVALLTVTAVEDDSGIPLYHVVQIQDITGRKRMEEQLRHLATHDPLTGLANRALLMERLDAAVGSPASVDRAVLYLDLDGFKGVNDTLGHAVGDRLLRAVADAIAGRLTTGQLAARIGGDEFVVLLERATTRAEVNDLAQRLVDAIAESPTVSELGLPISCSMGMALAEPGQRSTSLLRSADEALYAAKDARRTRTATGQLPRR